MKITAIHSHTKPHPNTHVFTRKYYAANTYTNNITHKHTLFNTKTYNIVRHSHTNSVAHTLPQNDALTHRELFAGDFAITVFVDLLDYLSEPLLALLRTEFVKSLRRISAQKGVVIVICIVMLVVPGDEGGGGDGGESRWGICEC